MIQWAILILLLDIVLFFQLRSCACFNTPTAIVTGCIAIGALGILIRTYRKIKAGQREKLSQKLESLEDQNRELLERIASIREKQIMDMTDEDLV